MRGRPDTPRARAFPRRTGHPDPALQGALTPLLPSSRACSGVPRPGLLAVPGRATASPSPQGCGGAACPPPAHRFPQLRRLRARPDLPRECIPCSRSASPFWRLRSDERPQEAMEVDAKSQTMPRAYSPPSLYSNREPGGRARAACVWRGRARSASRARSDAAARPRLPEQTRRGMEAGLLRAGLAGRSSWDPLGLKPPTPPLLRSRAGSGDLWAPWSDLKGAMHCEQRGEVDGHLQSHRVTWEGVNQVLIECDQARERAA